MVMPNFSSTDHGGDERQRDGRERNAGRARAANQEEQHHRHQDAASAREFFMLCSAFSMNVAGRWRRRIERDACLVEPSFISFKAAFQVHRDLHGVGAELAGHVMSTPGLP